MGMQSGILIFLVKSGGGPVYIYIYIYELPIHRPMAAVMFVNG